MYCMTLSHSIISKCSLSQYTQKNGIYSNNHVEPLVQLYGQKNLNCFYSHETSDSTGENKKALAQNNIWK